MDDFQICSIPHSQRLFDSKFFPVWRQFSNFVLQLYLVYIFCDIFVENIALKNQKTISNSKYFLSMIFDTFISLHIGNCCNT